MNDELEQYRREMEIELKEILSWWESMAVDKGNGGFVGKIDHGNRIDAEAPKGSVLNSRILWAFSSAYQLTGNKQYLSMANRAFEYFARHFIDGQFGGVYWTVDSMGNPLDTKKQIYASAFAVYGLSEYYRATGEGNSKQLAIDIYNDAVSHSYEEKFGGYVEAFTRDWKALGDLRLSPKDANEKKSMNTHLHLVEAFTNLYRAWNDGNVKQRVAELVNIFLDHIVDQRTHHLTLFFDDAWNPRSHTISYGHDIEAAWLLQEAVDTIGHDSLLVKVKSISTKLAVAAAEGLDADGGLWYEYDTDAGYLIKQKHSWPQAEAMIGFFNAWQNTGDQKFYDRSVQSWKFVKQYMRDKDLGEWYWGVNDDHSPMVEQDKAGLWKCPYHNSRACIEIIKRIDSVLNQKP